MKKKLLTLGAVALGFSFANAQFVSYVEDNATVFVEEDALVTNWGGMKTVGTGKIVDEGQIMLLGDSTSKFATVNVNGSAKTDGGNFILRMTNENLGNLRYGQLYINGLVQNNITGIVDKEFKEFKHGTYQQIALPFYQKTFQSLSTDLGLTTPINNQRWSQKEVLVWNNSVVRSNYIPATNTGELANGINPSTAYFMLGAGGGLDVQTKKHVVKGIPYADGIKVTLTGAGVGIDFGTNGLNQNYYKEKYASYLQDSFASDAWKNDFGKNIYQFGNPFFTNLDVRYLGEQLSGIQGIKLPNANNSQVVTSSGTYTQSKVADYYITFANNGIAVGDVTKTIILPMQNIVIKMKDNTTGNRELNFDNLRRFLYSSAATTQSLREAYVKSNASQARKVNSVSTGTVKQLGVIAYDKDNNEIGRTYYVVYPDAVVGQPKEASTQVKASSSGILGTYEELKEGGVDNNLKDKYWLYINEANENQFKGKDIHLEVNDEYVDGTKANVDHLGFEIRENADLIADNQSSLSTGESFYVKSQGSLVKVAQGQNLPIAGIKSEDGVKAFKLYYGRPVDSVVETPGIGKPSEKVSETVAVLDDATKDYKLIFDATWKKASVKVLDINGRVVLSKDNVNTAEPFVINLPSKEKAVYVVTATSEKGKQFIQKIIK